MAALSVRVLGPVEITVDGEQRELRRAERAFVARLALAPGAAVTVERLIDDLWGDDLPADPVSALRVAASRVRRALGDASDQVETVGGGYRLAAGAWVDAVAFEAALVEARAAAEVGEADRAAKVLDAALAMWHGAALAEVGAPFAESHAVRLEELRVTAMSERFAAELAAGRHAAIIAELESAVRQHPLREELWSQLMLALYRAGRQADALRAYAQLRSRLVEELGIEPSAPLRRLETAIVRQDAELDVVAPVAARAREPELASDEPRVPLPLTRFIGRAAEREEIAASLQGARLVTIVGPAGIGKTRLALEIAARWPRTTADVVQVVDLTPLTDGASVASSVAVALDVGQSGEDALSSVRDLLAEQSTVLVLDNCEHVLEAAATLVATLLPSASRARVLATSRQPLGVAGEVLHRLDPLDADDAVALFRDRTALRGTDGGDDGSIRRLCDLVERLPLSIELAAALTPALTVTQVADRLADPLRLLSVSHAASPRHRSLRNAIASSWDLLSDVDRTVASRLSSFAGSWTLEAAETVAGAEPLSTSDVAPALARLVDASLINVVDDFDGRRFRFLVAVRQLAAEHLAAAPDADTIYRRLLTWCRELVDGTDLLGTDQAQVGRRLRAENDNIRAAIEAALGTVVAPEAAELAIAVVPYWIQRGHYAEGRRLLTLVGREERATIATRASAFAFAGLFALQAADLVAAEAALAEGLPLARQSGDDLAIAQNLYHLGFVALARGWPARARETLVETLALAERLGRARSISAANDALGQVAMVVGDVDEATERFTTSLSLIREVGDVDGMLRTMANQSAFASIAGRVDAAATLLEEATQLAAEAGAAPNQAEVERSQGLLAMVNAALDDAVVHLDRARDLFASFDADQEVASIELTLASIHLERGDRGLAERLAQPAWDRLQRMGADRWTVEGLDVLAAIAHSAGDDQRARELLDRAESARAERGMRRFGYFADSAAKLRRAIEG